MDIEIIRKKYKSKLDKFNLSDEDKDKILIELDKLSKIIIDSYLEIVTNN